MSKLSPHRANLKDDYTLIKRAAENQKKQDVINAWVKSKIQTTYIHLNEPFIDCNYTNAWKKG
jgi:peptidyl-prolyl cis-trans isomerase SurA